uniref:Phenoloxidase-activating factor 2 n=1 Tax=Timema poppense TaxID=170557 RepID=A0A7R9CUE3_TIMPO|nr:unnamed protein product [Timema poppensis]
MFQTGLSVVALAGVLMFTTPVTSQEDGEFWWLRRPATFSNGGGGGEGADLSTDQTGAASNSNAAQPDVEGIANVDPALLNELFGPPPDSAGTPDLGPVTSGIGAVDYDKECICVDYYQCGTDGYIITTGEGSLEPRLNAPKTKTCTSSIQVCCKPPPKDGKKVEPGTGDRNEQGDGDKSDPGNPPVDPLVVTSQCGIRGRNPNQINESWFRILDTSGEENSTQFAEFPWMLVMVRSELTNTEGEELNMFQCGASLLHPQVALTAAHCVSGVPMGELKLRAGEWDSQQKIEPLPHQDRRVAKVIVHPDYYKGTLFNDIALMILDEPFQLDIHIGTICLPDPSADFDNSRCIATGWGKNAFDISGKWQTTLKKVELPIVPHAKCEKELQNTRLSPYFRLDKSFLCAGGEPGKDTCQGDGGGPLVCPSSDDMLHYVQVGVVSWGIGCGDTQVPAVYTNVARYTQWIGQQLQRSGFQLQSSD